MKKQENCEMNRHWKEAKGKYLYEYINIYNVYSWYNTMQIKQKTKYKTKTKQNKTKQKQNKQTKQKKHTPKQTKYRYLIILNNVQILFVL